MYVHCCTVLVDKLTSESVKNKCERDPTICFSETYSILHFEMSFKYVYYYFIIIGYE